MAEYGCLVVSPAMYDAISDHTHTQAQAPVTLRELQIMRETAAAVPYSVLMGYTQHWNHPAYGPCLAWRAGGCDSKYGNDRARILYHTCVSPIFGKALFDTEMLPEEIRAQIFAQNVIDQLDRKIAIAQEHDLKPGSSTQAEPTAPNREDAGSSPAPAAKYDQVTNYTEDLVVTAT